MDDDMNGKTITCITPSSMSAQQIDPLLLPLMMPIMLLNSLITIVSNSTMQFQQNQLGNMNPMSAFTPMGSMGTNTVVDVKYDIEGNITRIHERTW